MTKNKNLKAAVRSEMVRTGDKYTTTLRTLGSPLDAVQAPGPGSVRRTLGNLQVGDQVQFTPQAGRGWWTVQAGDDRWIVATQQAMFEPKGRLWYTCVDTYGWDYTYNGATGIVRSSLDYLGGGFDLDEDGTGCDDILALLQLGRENGGADLSRRRVVSVTGVETRSRH